MSGYISCLLSDDQGIHGHRSGTAIYDVNGMFAGRQTGDFTHCLFCLARAGRGQIRCRTALAVNLNLDLASSRFFWRDHRNVRARERSTPDITGRLADGEVIIEVASAQVAAAYPSRIRRARVVVIDPALVMGDAQNPARRS